MKWFVILGTVVAAWLPIAARSQTLNSVSCVVEDVAAYTDRVHIKCSNPTTAPIIYFAVAARDEGRSTGDGGTASSERGLYAARYLAVALAAANNSDLAVMIWYDPNDDSGPRFGCLLENCRPAAGVTIVPPQSGRRRRR